MLSLTHFDDRNITGEHHAFKSGLLPGKSKYFCLHFFRSLPVRTDDICSKSFFLKNLLIGMEFFRTLGKSLAIGYDGKCRR